MKTVTELKYISKQSQPIHSSHNSSGPAELLLLLAGGAMC